MSRKCLGSVWEVSGKCLGSTSRSVAANGSPRNRTYDGNGGGGSVEGGSVGGAGASSAIWCRRAMTAGSDATAGAAGGSKDVADPALPPPRRPAPTACRLSPTSQ